VVRGAAHVQSSDHTQHPDRAFRTTGCWRGARAGRGRAQGPDSGGAGVATAGAASEVYDDSSTRIAAQPNAKYMAPNAKTAATAAWKSASPTRHRAACVSPSASAT